MFSASYKIDKNGHSERVVAMSVVAHARVYTADTTCYTNINQDPCTGQRGNKSTDPAGTNQWIAHVWWHAADSCVFACMCRTMERKVVTGNPDILFEQVHEF